MTIVAIRFADVIIVMNPLAVGLPHIGLKRIAWNGIKSTVSCYGVNIFKHLHIGSFIAYFVKVRIDHCSLIIKTY